MSEQNPTGRWQPGTSGNPAGRPRGSGEVAKLRTAIAEHVPDILERLIEDAKGGDVQAARLLLERAIPPIKAVEATQAVDLPGETMSEQGRAILSAVAAGELAPGQGATLISALGSLARVVEVDELLRRIEALEARSGPKEGEA